MRWDSAIKIEGNKRSEIQWETAQSSTRAIRSLKSIWEHDCVTKSAIVQMLEIDLCMYHKTRFLHFLKKKEWCFCLYKRCLHNARVLLMVAWAKVSILLILLRIKYIYNQLCACASFTILHHLDGFFIFCIYTLIPVHLEERFMHNAKHHLHITWEVVCVNWHILTYCILLT